MIKEHSDRTLAFVTAEFDAKIDYVARLPSAAAACSKILECKEWVSNPAITVLRDDVRVHCGEVRALSGEVAAMSPVKQACPRRLDRDRLSLPTRFRTIRGPNRAQSKSLQQLAQSLAQRRDELFCPAAPSSSVDR